MHVVFHYRPAGATPRSWPFEPVNMTNGEAEEIEDVTDLTFIEWQSKVLRGSVKATHALLWVKLKAEVPGLRYDAVQFKAGETEFEFVEDADDEEPGEDAEAESEPVTPDPKDG